MLDRRLAAGLFAVGTTVGRGPDEGTGRGGRRSGPGETGPPGGPEPRAPRGGAEEPGRCGLRGDTRPADVAPPRGRHGPVRGRPPAAARLLPHLAGAEVRHRAGGTPGSTAAPNRPLSAALAAVSLDALVATMGE
ncbi:hypothetical protein GCM10010272_22010 [Streptomyces lateritius]|nr:hypothetical protein GCM10010272_22010 [Streptomyces lateritius]